MKKTLRGTCMYPAGKDMPEGRTHGNLVRTQARAGKRAAVYALPGRDSIKNAYNVLSSAVRVVFSGMNIRQEGAGA